MKAAVFLLAVVAMAQAGPINLSSHVISPESDTFAQETRQFNIGPADIATAIYELLKLVNYTPTVSQAIQILDLARRLVGLISSVRQGLVSLQTAFNTISQELAKIFKCQDNPQQVDGLVVGLMQSLGLLNGGKFTPGPGQGQTAMSTTGSTISSVSSASVGITTTTTSATRVL